MQQPQGICSRNSPAKVAERWGLNVCKKQGSKIDENVQVNFLKGHYMEMHLIINFCLFAFGPHPTVLGAYPDSVLRGHSWWSLGECMGSYSLTHGAILLVPILFLNLTTAIL